MARPLRQARQERHKTTERLARRQALGGHDTVVREAKVPVQARYAETCNPPSSSVHSHDQRRLADLPWGALAVRLQLLVRKFVCRHFMSARSATRISGRVGSWWTKP